MRMYHATKYDNLNSILDNGILKGPDGIVYLTTKPDDAVKFLFIRQEKKILVIEVEIPKSKLIEQFDHNESFFQCKAYGYANNIPVDKINKCIKYDF